MSKVYVVMGNDYPDAVFSTEADAGWAAVDLTDPHRKKAGTPDTKADTKAIQNGQQSSPNSSSNPLK